LRDVREAQADLKGIRPSWAEPMHSRRERAVNRRSPHIVSDVMTPTVVAVELDAQFKEIVTAMKKWQVTAMPVLEREGRVAGVVSEADLLAKEELRDTEPTLIGQRERLADYAKAGAVTARDLMSAPAVTVRAGATLPQAARLMARHKVKRLPVVDEQGLLRGIVSRSDLLKVFLRTDEDIADEVRHEVIDRFFPVSRAGIQVTVDKGCVTITGTVRDGTLIALAERLTRAVEGVVDVRCDMVASTALDSTRRL
jgi:CBS domain-containing protein